MLRKTKVAVGIGLCSLGLLYFQDSLADFTETVGWKAALRPLYRKAVYSTLTMAGRNPMCATAESKANIYAVAEAASKSGLRHVKDDGGMSLYETPHGDFWLPRNVPLDGVHIMMAEGVSDIYGFEKANLHDAIVLDCGANLGAFTRTALNKGARKVVAIEPAPDLVACLRRTFEKEIGEGRVIVFPGGVWNKEDKLALHLSDSPWTNSLVPWAGSEGGSKRQVQVPLVPMDKLVADLKLDRVDFIKMDIEGAEVQALEGGVTTIETFRPVMAIATEHTSDILRNTQQVLDLVAKMKPRYSPNCEYCLWGSRIPSIIYPEVIYFRPSNDAISAGGLTGSSASR